MSTAYPTPWTFEAEDEFENTPIRAANGEYVLVRDNGAYPPDIETCREIVEAVNWYFDWGAMSAELERLRDERDRLRDLVKRLITIHQNIFWRKDEKTGVLYYDCAIDEEKIRKTIEEARAALGEDRP